MNNTQKTIRALLYFALSTGTSAVVMLLGVPGPLKSAGRVMLAITIVAVIAAGVVYWIAARQPSRGHGWPGIEPRR